MLKRNFVTILVLSMLLGAANAAETKPTYLDIARTYADAMIIRGRDTYGEEHSPLFAAVLDRQTMKLGSFPRDPGVRRKDRAQYGANPQVEFGLYHILYTLSDLLNDPYYAGEADRTLEFFFENCQSETTGLMAWGEHLFWNLLKDELDESGQEYHEICGEWPFWDRCYALVPDACWAFSLGLWDHQVFDKKTGHFSRHARYREHGPEKGAEFPRYAGQMILNWAVAYARDENRDRPRRDELLEAIEVIMGRMRANMAVSELGYLPHDTATVDKILKKSKQQNRPPSAFVAETVWWTSNLELARCLLKAAPLVPEDLGRKMEDLALTQHRHYLGFDKTVARLDQYRALLETGGKGRKDAFNPWATGYGKTSSAGVANAYYAAYRQLAGRHEELAQKYRILFLGTATQYLNSHLNPRSSLRPDAVYPAVELLVNAFIATEQEAFLQKAHEFARTGIEIFLDDRSALPKASNRLPHYETITGGPEFMYQLLRLYLTDLYLHGESPVPAMNDRRAAFDLMRDPSGDLRQLARQEQARLTAVLKASNKEKAVRQLLVKALEDRGETGYKARQYLACLSDPYIDECLFRELEVRDGDPKVLKLLVRRRPEGLSACLKSMTRHRSGQVRATAWQQIGRTFAQDELGSLIDFVVTREPVEPGVARDAVVAVAERSVDPVAVFAAAAAALDKTHSLSMQVLLDLAAVAGTRETLAFVQGQVGAADDAVNCAAIDAVAVICRQNRPKLSILDIEKNLSRTEPHLRSPADKQSFLTAAASNPGDATLAMVNRFLDDPEIRAIAEKCAADLAWKLRLVYRDRVTATATRLQHSHDEAVAASARKTLESLADCRASIREWLHSPVYDSPELDKVWPPETGEEPSWQRVVRGVYPHYLNLKDTAGDKKGCCIYLRSLIASPVDQKVRFAISADDAMKIWLNGQLLKTVPWREGRFRPGRDEVEAELKKGRNEILLKVTQGSGGWKASCAVTDPDGKPLAGLSHSVPK